LILKEKMEIEDIFGSKARIKIIKVLISNQELSITQIIRKTCLNHGCVLKHLNLLKKINLIQEKNFGRIKIYRYRSENIKAKSLKRFVEIWEGEI
jgi:predicted transcriptional regulator